MSLKEFQKSQELQEIQKQLQNPQKHQRQVATSSAKDTDKSGTDNKGPNNGDDDDDDDDEMHDAVENLDELLSPTDSNASDEQMSRALEQSKAEHDAELARNRAMEEEQIQRAIQKSLQDQWAVRVSLPSHSLRFPSP